ncbi:MAG: hypothetical protein E7471_03345 [Ruminococcaceae bacterium]|nr:hypothetical protein [Oscillospiraceae bacterium]
MKKRVLSLVIAVCMLVSLLPVVGVAADATPDYSIQIKDYAADNSISSLNNSISKEQTADYGAWSFTGARSAGVSYSGKIYMGNGYYGVNVTINEPGLYRAEMIYDTTTTSADAAVYIAPYGTNNAIDDRYKIVDIPWADADALGIVAESAEDFQLAEGEYTIYFKANASWCRTANVNPETGRTEDYHVAPGEPIPAKKPDYVDGVLTNAEGWTLGSRDRYFCMDKLNLYKVGEVPAESVVIENAPTGILEVGVTAELSAAILPAAAAYQSAEWSTSDASVVTVENGVIEAVGIGFATVTATVGDLTDSVVITVAEKAND